MKTGGQCCCRLQAKWLQLRVRVTRRYQMPGTSSTLAAFVKTERQCGILKTWDVALTLGGFQFSAACCIEGLHKNNQVAVILALKLICDVLIHIAYCIMSPNRIEMSWMSKDISNIKSPYIPDSWRGQTMNGGALWLWLWHYTQSNAENVPGVGC